jgi:hypothetical protein
MTENQAIHSNLIDQGLSRLARAVVEVSFEPQRQPLAAPLAVIDCILATEYVLRGRILEVENSNAEKKDKKISDIRLQQLVSGSKGFDFYSLPNELFQSTGYSIKNIEEYNSFGNLKNALVRRSFERDFLVETTLRYAFQVLEPMIMEFWDDLILIHASEYEFETDEYVDRQLTKYGILVKPRFSEEDE